VAARAEAARLREVAARYDSALARRIDTSGDRFTMEIDGRRHTKRVDAGDHLTRHVRQALADLADGPSGRHELPARTISHLGGFPLSLDGCRIGLTTEVRLTLALDHHGQGPELRLRPEDLDGKRPDTLITQLEGRLRRLEAERDRAVAAAEEHERRADEAEARTGQSSPDQHRLDDLRRRYRLITDELQADNQEATRSSDRGPAAPEIDV
jgi:hypothetical protein